eukprot:403377026
MSSLIKKFQEKAQASGIAPVQQTTQPIQKLNTTQSMIGMGVNRSKSLTQLQGQQNPAIMNKQSFAHIQSSNYGQIKQGSGINLQNQKVTNGVVSTSGSSIPNISRKSVISQEHNQKPSQQKSALPTKLHIQSKDLANKQHKPKFNLDQAMFTGKDELQMEKTGQLIIDRSIQNQQKMFEKMLDQEMANDNLFMADNHEKTAISSGRLSVEDALARCNKKIASAQAKMSIGSFGNKQQQQAKVPPFQSYHNADQLIATADHSDIKHTQKTLFNNMENTDSTNMTSSGMRPSISGNGNNQLTTPIDTYKASQFTLNVLGDSNNQDGLKAGKKSHATPVASQFNSNESKMTRLQSTDEEGNRQSIMPGRPSISNAGSTVATKKAPSVRKAKATATKNKVPKEFDDKVESQEAKKAPNMLEKMTTQIEKLKTSKAIQKQQASLNPDRQNRTNFVKMNLKAYKPRMRGGAFQNKMMAKKKNQLKFNDRIKRKMQIEAAKNRDQVNAFGGLGKVGLEYAGGNPNHRIDDIGNLVDENGNLVEDLVPGFSTSALKYVKKVAKTLSEIDEQEDNGDDEQLLDGDEEIKHLHKIDEELKEEEDKNEEEIKETEELPTDFDIPLYKIPDSDEEYTKILKDKFGHESFRAGQLEAIKILLVKKENALVVLATGGGKSLVYQYVSMFMNGLIIIVTPLISLMTDQLGKLPDFLPGASLNSHQNYQLKKEVIKAIQDKHIKVLFISPEKFFMEDFSKYNRKIAMVCVDEIHCASEWSHNFRPAYLKLHDMIKEKVTSQKDSCVVLGLTATATKATQKSVCKIFNVQYPEHIVTEPNLSRMNLSLSITRDTDKLKSLMQLMSSGSFKKLTSQNGINSSAYHAGKSDQQRQIIQKNFINNNIRVLVCTIAFSMGIDKSDIQSVIHYDMPKSIENYVQEIGRAGRDGKLARCHMFLNNEDFYLIRRLILTDLLDNQNALKLTNKIIVEFKRAVMKILKPNLIKSKKRKLNKVSGSEEDQMNNGMIEEFEHEEELKKYYEKQEDGVMKIFPESISAIENPNRLYLFLDVKETLSLLDLKKEVVLTMLNSLEKTSEEKRFFSLEGVLPDKIGMRFHSKRPEQMALENPFIKKFLEIAKEHQGVYNVSLQRLAYELNMNPFHIPKILYSMQSTQGNDISYDTDNESFVLKICHIPSGGQTLELSQDMLKETRRIERNMVQKLNCMYFVARRVSLINVDVMLKKEKQEADNGLEMYKGFSNQLNDLINLYFSIENEDDMEVQVAGDEEKRNEMMPLIYINSHRDKASVESEIKSLLKEFHEQSSSLEANDRLKALDVVKILMGIYSDKPSIKRYANNGKVWAKYQDYDYVDLQKVATLAVNQFYLDQVNGVTTNNEQADNGKRRKVNS